MAGKPASAGEPGKKVPSRGKAAAMGKGMGGEEEAARGSAPPETRREMASKGL